MKLPKILETIANWLRKTNAYPITKIDVYPITTSDSTKHLVIILTKEK